MSTKQPDKGYYKHPNEALHERLAETHDRLVSIEVAMRDHVDPGLARLAAELTALRGLAEKGFNPDFVSAKLDGISKGIADHEIRISGLEAGFVVLESETARAHGRVTRVEEVVAEDREVNRATSRRVAVLEERVWGEGFPFVQVFLGIIAGIFAGWLWHVHEFVATVSPDGTTVKGYAPANEWYVAALFGLGVAGVIAGVFWLLSLPFRKARVEEAQYQAEAQEAFNRRTTVQRSETNGNTPATEVLPTQPAGKTS